MTNQKDYYSYPEVTSPNFPKWRRAGAKALVTGFVRTEADGLAVPRASELAAAVVRPFLGGVYTVADETLFEHLHMAAQSETIRIEPSAAAGFSGPGMLLGSDAGRAYLQRQGLDGHMAQSTHLVWTTGGLFVPDEEYARFRVRGAIAARASESVSA